MRSCALGSVHLTHNFKLGQADLQSQIALREQEFQDMGRA